MSIIPNGSYIKQVLNGVRLDELFEVIAYHPEDNTYEVDLLEETVNQTSVSGGLTNSSVSIRRTGKIGRLSAVSVEVVNII